MLRFIQLLICALLLAIAAQAIWLLWLRQKSLGWFRVTGTVTVARIVRGCTAGREDNKECFEVEVRYEYKVRGKTYAGANYSIGSPQFTRYDEAIDALEGITAGREVSVYYDPRRPQRSVLKKG